MFGNRYSKNLRYDKKIIYSYNTPVAKIGRKNITTSKFYSQTTSKHINYVGGLLGKKVKRNY